MTEEGPARALLERGIALGIARPRYKQLAIEDDGVEFGL